MYLNAFASALPETAYSQQESWQILRRHLENAELKDRSVTLLEKVLNQDSGIAKRHFAISDPDLVFGAGAEAQNKAFEIHAPALASAAIQKALDRAGQRPGDIDALFVSTCTGYLCPGVSSYVAEAMGLKANAFLHDSVGQGCGAAIPLLRSAEGFLAANPDLTVATVSVEVCSAAFFIDDDPGVLISLCLFGDGASASIWSGKNSSPDAWRTGRFDTVHQPHHREKIRFVNDGGRLRNKLHRSVPKLAAEAVGELFQRRQASPDQIVSHSGGRDVIDAIEGTLPTYQLKEARSVLRDCGNCSSPSVMMALEERLMAPAGTRNDDDHHLWLTSFGAGFAAHSMELSRS